MENKNHYKLYKSGKNWVTALVAISALSIGMFYGSTAYAADGQGNAATSQVQSGQISGQPETATKENVSQNYDHQDNGDYGWVDQVNFDHNQLHVSGWQATNQAVNKDHRFTIVYDDTSNKELGRNTETSVARPDVALVHNVYNAGNSGFNTNVKLNFNNMNDYQDSIRVVSRYSNSENGEGQTADWWSQPINFDKGNYACLDQFNVTNGNLQVSGWNATNQAINKQHHFIILFDQTTNREISRQEVFSGQARSDVAKVYPQVINADQSGFQVTFAVANLNSQHQYRIISRYSNASNGEGSYVDYWFDPRRLAPANQANFGSLDLFDLSNGNNLEVSGWQATNLSGLESNRFIILFDQTANRQVASVKVTNVARPDVAKAYPGVLNAGIAGFKASFDLPANSLQAGHSYAIVSRYSADPNGNGNDGQHTDYWFNPIKLDQTASSIDSIQMTEKGLRVQGWMASDNSLTQSNAYLILLNNGKEITRQPVTFIVRPDVAKAYPHLYNSAKSGFDTVVNLTSAQLARLNGNLQILMRFSKAQDGNPINGQGVTDQLSRNYATNLGNGTVKLTNNQMIVNGWHAVMNKQNRKYQYLIVVGLDGHEFYRQKLDSSDSNLASPEATTQAAWIRETSQTGFKTTLPVNSDMNHRAIKIIHRYTDDPNGNGNYLDYTLPQIDINDGFQSKDGGTVYYDPTNGQIVTGWRTINGHQYYFSDGYDVQPNPDDLWVYNEQLHGRMYTGVNWVDGHCYDFGSDGIARAQSWRDGWSWPFPSSGEGYFAPGQRFGYSSYPRKNGFHDGLDFGTSDHPGSAVHAVHGGRVLDVNTVNDDNGNPMWWFTTIWDGKYLYVYQEAFSNRNKITVKPNDIVDPGQVIGYRDLSHLHLGINTSPNYGIDLKHSFQPSWHDENQATHGGTWLNPESVIRNHG